MSADVWLLYVGTVLVFMAAPGPSHLLMLSVSMSNGFSRSLATAAGDLTANAIQILLAGLGLAAVITDSGSIFSVVKWAGVAYLIWIGLGQIITSFKSRADANEAPKASVRRLWLRGFVTSAANPKAVVFFAALFPQFIDTQIPVAPQIAILGITYIVIDGTFLSAYGKGASWLAQKIRVHHRKWLDRAAGSGLIGAAILLGVRGVGRG